MELKESTTYQNLKTAFAGESEARNKYTYYASKAQKEGYNQIETVFAESAENEKEHAKIWFKLLNSGIASTKENLKDAIASENLERGTIFSKPKEEIWICSNCGYSISAKQAPETCPVCAHPQGYFILGETGRF
ncbi:rubrerythrin [Clostridia bacterium]|nr:rubrerythrin [Clostridia bacterium]